MARLFQRQGKFWLDYHDGRGKRVRRPAARDKRVAEKMLQDAVTAAEREQAGLCGVDPRHAKKPIGEHVADYRAELSRLGRDERYVYLTGNRIDNAAKFCGWRSIGDINALDVERFLNNLSADGRTPKTINEARGDLSAFCNWAVRGGRMSYNPVAKVQKTADKREKTRRGLSALECQQLLDAAPRRRLVYLFLIYTGLRRSEAKAITWGHVHLDSLNPSVELPASITKSGKAERVPLVAALAEALQSARGRRQDGDPVFRSLPKMRTFRADLRAAGIEEVDSRGRRVVLHSLRHALASMLVNSNVPMAIAQRIMRHRDIRLTAETYQDEALLPLAKSMESLPVLSIGNEACAEQRTELALAATGTDGPVRTSPRPRSMPRADLREAKPRPARQVPSEVPNSGLSLALPGNSPVAEPAAKAPERPPESRLGNVGLDVEKCGRQESNLHGLAATGT